MIMYVMDGICTCIQPHIYKTWLKAPVQFLETESGDGSDTQSDTSKKNGASDFGQNILKLNSF